MCRPMFIYITISASSGEASFERTLRDCKESVVKEKAKRCSIYKTDSWRLGLTYICFNAVLELTPRNNILSDKLIVSRTFGKFLNAQLNFCVVFVKTSNRVQCFRI
jgi:hypothetical protein